MEQTITVYHERETIGCDGIDDQGRHWCTFELHGRAVMLPACAICQAYIDRGWRSSERFPPVCYVCTSHVTYVAKED